MNISRFSKYAFFAICSLVIGDLLFRRSVNKLLILLIIVGIINIIYPIVQFFRDRSRYKKLRFSICISAIFFLSLIFFIWRGIHWIFLLTYVLLFIVTLVFVSLVRNIKNSCSGNRKISEFKFFIYMASFAFILFFYIEVFSIFYLNANPFNQGSIGFLSKGNEIKLLDAWESFYFSGYTFFSMSYDDIQANLFLNFVVVFELLVAQILIITFIGILASILLAKLKLNKVG